MFWYGEQLYLGPQSKNIYANSISSNICLSRFQHKMFYKTKSTTRRASDLPTVTTQNDALSEWNGSVKVNKLEFRAFLLGSQQFFIYSIDGRTTGHANVPNTHLDLPPKYEDVIKDPNYVRREVA